MAILHDTLEQFTTAAGITYFQKKNTKGEAVYAKLNCHGAKNSGSTPVSKSEYERLRKRPDSTLPKRFTP